VNISYIIPKEGTALWFDMMAIPKDAPNADNAHAFINYIMRPDVIAPITDYVAYANPNKASDELVDPEIRNDPAIYPTDEVLERLAGFMEKDFALKKKVKSALTYPVVILVMALGIVFFLVTYILPTFVELFKGMNLTLPLPTKILIGITEAARQPMIVIPTIVLMVGVGIGIGKYVQTPVGRKQYDLLKLNIPVFGILTKKVAISRFCRTLGTLLSSGVPIMQALEIVGKASGNEIIAMTVTKVRESIREGESIASPLGASGLFPPMVTQMVAVGEETGNLDAMLGKIADFYDTEVEYLLASLTSMLEPIMIVGMGGIVGFIVISVFLPLYQLIGNLG